VGIATLATTLRTWTSHTNLVGSSQIIELLRTTFQLRHRTTAPTTHHRINATTFATSTRSLLLQATALWTNCSHGIHFGDGHALTRIVQVNVPKTRRTYCKGKDCKKHTQHKVTR